MGQHVCRKGEDYYKWVRAACGEAWKNLDSNTGQGDAQSVAKGTGNVKAAIVGAVGAVLGTVAATLASRLKLRELTALSKV